VNWEFQMTEKRTITQIAYSSLAAISLLSQLFLKAMINKTGKVGINVILRRVRVTTTAPKSSKYFIFWLCVCSLFIQHIMRMRRIILSAVACQVLRYFSKAGRFSRESYWPKNVYFDFLYIFCFRTFLILRRIKPDIIIHLHGFSWKKSAR